MTLQAKLTLGTVLLATVIVTVISAVDLGNIMQLELDASLQRAQLVRDIAGGNVVQALNSQPDSTVKEALGTDRLFEHLMTVMKSSHEIVEVAVVDADNEIVADSIPDRRGERASRYADFTPLVQQAGWRQELGVLLHPPKSYYQLEQKLGPSPKLDVRVIVAPVLIRELVQPALNDSADTAMLSLVCAIAVTFLFSAFAFRPLGVLRRQLDLLASGDYEPPQPAAKAATDEFSIMASKVSLLGERLRGAQYEVSDLRGNIDRLLQDLEDAVLIFNRERRLVYASGSVDRFLGSDRASLSGQSLAGIFPPSTNLGFLIAQASESGMSLARRRIPPDAAAEKDGRGAVLLSVELLEPQSGLLVRLRDPEAQRKLGHQLETADRLAAISRISGGVAHEVKNPLNAILLHVEVARTRLAHGETDVSPQMEIISREILRLDRVVKTFLDFTRPVELHYDTVALREVVGELVELARPQADAGGIRLMVRDAAEGVDVRVDRDLFKQAVLNVLVNAMQAMPDGGEVRIECEPVRDSVEIRISDAGAGIPPELREKIFRLYFTTKPGGSGIGLAMTFRIVQLHDGTIDFSSEPGIGTTFVIRLPIAA